MSGFCVTQPEMFTLEYSTAGRVCSHSVPGLVRYTKDSSGRQEFQARGLKPGFRKRKSSQTGSREYRRQSVLPGVP
jgi:hypothetical protein